MAPTPSASPLLPNRHAGGSAGEGTLHTEWFLPQSSPALAPLQMAQAAVAVLKAWALGSQHPQVPGLSFTWGIQ